MNDHETNHRSQDTEDSEQVGAAASNLLSLFDPPPPLSPANSNHSSMALGSTASLSDNERIPLLQSTPSSEWGTLSQSSLMDNYDSIHGYNNMDEDDSSRTKTPKQLHRRISNHHRPRVDTTEALPVVPETGESVPVPSSPLSPHSFPNYNLNGASNPFYESPQRGDHAPPEEESIPEKPGWVKRRWDAILPELLSPSTYMGAFLFLLFELVFSLTLGATITRPHGSGRPLLGLVTEMAALGTIVGAPLYWWHLPDVPALYPVVDLFAAPFLAHLAAVVDETLYSDPNVTDAENDAIFLTTFSFLASLSLLVSGGLTILAGAFKLANLGAYLPYPVLCGFFTAAACLTWTLAFKVDTNGLTVQHVLGSGDRSLMLSSLVHHIPSVLVGATMKYLGPKHPLSVLLSVLITIGLFYCTMFLFGISFEEMVEHHWFWSDNDLHYVPPEGVPQSFWATPAPFGWITGMVRGQVHWGAVLQGLETTLALSCLYLIRCSLHGTALKKNVATLSRMEKVKPIVVEPLKPLTLARKTTVKQGHRRRFSEVVDIDGLPQIEATTDATVLVTAKPTQATLKEILVQYGYSQWISSLVGGFAIIPCVATAPTMFMLGAEKLAPQLGAALLLGVFYFTDFALVQFIPKTAFSSLLLLSSIDMLSNWCIKSYSKTEQKLEWLVVPLIVIFAFTVGLLQSVFIGIAISTFIFVATFFRSGVVKYVANGVHVRSTIERPPKVSRWLDKSAIKIQILVMQNYLFFGNASSMIAYISMMFDEADKNADPSLITPCPKIVIIDMTLVTGMDTSAVDAFKDIMTVCGNNDCKLFLSGVSPQMQNVMKRVGVHPGNGSVRSQRKLRFFVDLDAAIGKAEDVLIELESFVEEVTLPYDVQQRDGFYKALYHIDVQHNTSFATELSELRSYATLLDIDPGDELYEENNDERGLFFIEHGILKMERSSNYTMSRVGGGTFSRYTDVCTLNGRDARFLSTMSAQVAPRFRLARVCPGWVIGSLEALAGAKPGQIVAVTHCRLHYISYSKVEEIESSNPQLVLKLYKLLSHLMTKRQEITISQLGTLHAIMGSPSCKKPVSRSLSSLSIS